MSTEPVGEVEVGVHRRGAVVAHEKDEAVVQLALPPQELSQHADRGIEPAECPMHRR